MSRAGTTTYDDGAIRCDDQCLIIRGYYPWGAKRIACTSIKGIETLDLTGTNKVRAWRIWGTGDFIHWCNFDGRRPRRNRALVIDVGRRVRPTITPDDPDAVLRILTAGRGSR